jgi:hypothetical protein
MLHGTHRIHQRDAAMSTYSNKSKNGTSTDSSDSNAPSFGDQLADAFESFFTQTSDGTPVDVTITPQEGQDSGTRQFLVTLKDPSATPAATSATTSTGGTPAATTAATPIAPTPAASPLVNYGAMSPFYYDAAKYASEHPDDPTGAIAAAADTAPPASSSVSSSASGRPTNETDAYWAQFPKEVQALRDIPSRDDRISAAWGLVQKGYTIDSEIMVLGNDPYATMLMRQQNGYTWTPAMGQQPIDLQPGLQMAGHAAYDPKNPPAGSIPVSLDFAKGLESTSPAMQYNSITTAT